MSFWKNLFGDASKPIPARTSSQEEKDVGALCLAAFDAVDFLTRHNLKGSLYGDAALYRSRVADAFRIAAEKILPAKDVEAIFMARVKSPDKYKYRVWSDGEMCSIFLLQLDQAIALIGLTPEMPLVGLKADLQTFGS